MRKLYCPLDRHLSSIRVFYYTLLFSGSYANMAEMLSSTTYHLLRLLHSFFPPDGASFFLFLSILFLMLIYQEMLMLDKFVWAILQNAYLTHRLHGAAEAYIL